MKTIYEAVIITLVALVVLTASYPNSRTGAGYNDVGMEANRFEEERSLVDEGADYNSEAGFARDSDTAPDSGFDYNPIEFSPLSDFIQRMQTLMKRVQLQMGQVLSRMPPQNIDWGKLGNTTSHTKIVNGHVVTVNETTYKNEDANSSSVVRVLVQEVRPTDSDQEVLISSTYPSRDYTTRNGDTKIEDLDADIDHNYRRGSEKFKRHGHRQRAYIDSRVLDSVDNSVDVFQPSHAADLASDTRVNDLMRDRSKGGLVMIDPDAELIEVENGHVRRYSPTRHFYNQQRRQPIFN